MKRNEGGNFAFKYGMRVTKSTLFMGLFLMSEMEQSENTPSHLSLTVHTSPV